MGRTTKSIQEPIASTMGYGVEWNLAAPSAGSVLKELAIQPGQMDRWTDGQIGGDGERVRQAGKLTRRTVEPTSRCQLICELPVKCSPSF